MSDSSKQLIRGMANLCPEHHGSVVTIGAFDGVHLGHQAIIAQVVEQSARLQLPAVAVIFEPLPREYFQPAEAVPRLLPFREKCLALWQHGIDRILCLHFNRRLSQIEPEAFIRRILVDGLGVQHLVVGDDFRFGNNREGGRALLEEAAVRHGFTVTSANTVEHGGERVSSSRIRQLLAEGDFRTAEACLGRPFQVSGKVIYGKQLGRQLGVPTANVDLKRLASPLRGIFAGWVSVPGRGRFEAVVNVGKRPTVNTEPKPLLEAHLFDCDESLYGKRVTVEFAKKLREEEKFDSVEELKVQIDRDIAEAKAYFEARA